MYSTKTKAMRDINREIYLQSTIKATNNSSALCVSLIVKFSLVWPQQIRERY